MRRCMPESIIGIFFLMLFAALILGLCSLNLFFLARANLELIYQYGWMALLDGALLQLLSLLMYGIFSLSAFIVFEACKKIILEKMLGK